MKNLKIGIVLIIVLLFLFTSSCKKDEDNSNDKNISTLENTVQDGVWIITKFIDSGDSEIHHFNGYIFTFKSNGVLLASKNSEVITGSWSITDDDSDDDSSDDSIDDLDFNILFTSPENFQDISDDWDVISNSKNRVELIDVSGGNGGTDYLTFEKN